VSFARANGFDVMSMSLAYPLNGLWEVRGVIDVGDKPAPTGAMALIMQPENGAASTWNGTFLSSLPDQGKAKFWAVAGAGGMRKVIAAADYDRPPARTVLSAILAAAGELAGDISGIDPFAQIVPVWTQFGGKASGELDALCAENGTSWRARPDGAIDVLVETWPAYPGEAFDVEPEDPDGRILLAQDAPDVRPGMTVLGKRIAHVTYVLTSSKFRTRIETQP